MHKVNIVIFIFQIDCGAKTNVDEELTNQLTVSDH